MATGSSVPRESVKLRPAPMAAGGDSEGHELLTGTAQERYPVMFPPSFPFACLFTSHLTSLTGIVTALGVCMVLYTFRRTLTEGS